MITTDDELKLITGMDNASSYQIDIFRFIQQQIKYYMNGDNTHSLSVTAVAGSGKTTTAVAASKLIPRQLSTVFLAFNKSIADELTTRLPNHIPAKTLNALGNSLLSPYLRGIGVSNNMVNSNRTYSIIRGLLPYNISSQLGKHINFLVGKCKAMGVISPNAKDGQGVDGMVATDTVLYNICKHYAYYIDNNVISDVFRYTRTVLNISFSDTDLYEHAVIDFDDQKWLPVCKRINNSKITNPTYDVIFVDEVQDLNGVAMEMIGNIIKPNGIIIGIGDKNQSILGFAGSDTEAFDKFSNKFNTTKLPLSVTYRCGKELVKHAQELIPSILPAPNAATGKVEYKDTWDHTIFSPKDMVLCRNNAPLLTIAYRLISHKIPVVVKGRNIGTGLISIIESLVAIKRWVDNPRKPGKKRPMMTTEGVTITTLIACLPAWYNNNKSMIRQSDQDIEMALQQLEDQYHSLQVLISMNTDGMVNSLISEINCLFSDDDLNKKVVLTTIHKSKGMEAERVFIYDYSLMYPKWIKPNTWQYQQEVFLDYIARTRGKTLFCYLTGDKDE